MGTTIISPTYRLSSARSCCGMATSSSSLSRYGLMMPRTLVTTIETSTTTTDRRYGLKNGCDAADGPGAALRAAPA